MKQERTNQWSYSQDRIILGVQMMSPRFTQLDRERSLSMADEGGVSAALIEGEDLQKYRQPGNSHPPSLEKDFWKNTFWIASSGLVGAGIGLLYLRNRVQRATT